MAYGFDINKFANHIDKHKLKKDSTFADHSGVATVIRHLWNHESIEDIDFDSFRMEDIEFALEEIDHLELSNIEGDDETFIVNPHNPFIIHLEMENALYHLNKEKNKLYESDDDEIFI